MAMTSPGKFHLLAAALATASLLGACGGNGDPVPTAAAPAPTPTGTLAGTAAVGSPIVGADVKISCSSGSPMTTVTSAAGTWQITTSGQMLPCGLQVNGGTINGAPNATPYHSIAVSFGNVNITPLTDLVVAKLAGTEPKTWFTAAKFDAITADSITSALGTLSTTLGLASTLGTVNPITSAFEAKTGDKIDNVLQALAKALPNLSKTYSELLTAAAANNLAGFSGFGAAFATAHSSVAGSSSTGSGSGTTTSCTTGQLSMSYAGIAGVFTDWQKLCITATTSSLAFSGKTLSSPVQNTAVSAPFAAYKFSDTDGSVYEAVFKDGAVYEINVLKDTKFQGQLTVASTSTGSTTGSTTTGNTGGTTGGGTTINAGTSGNRTLTLDYSFSVSGVTFPGLSLPSVKIENVSQPSARTEFCAANEKNTTYFSGIAAFGSYAIKDCTYSDNVGNIAVTLSITSFNLTTVVDVAVKFTYGP